MESRRRVNQLRLGPIIGHTDDSSTRIWIQVFDDPRFYSLRVQGAGIFQFVSTEGVLEFGTAIATARGLRPDWRYRYSVLRLGRFVPHGSGTFRTMPQPASMANLLFCAISCNGATSDGVWEAFGRYVDDAQPQFILMMGDQVYMDEDPPDVFEAHFQSSPAVRRKAFAEKYRLNWSREPVRRLLANTPTYMIWDDHDIRDGWGSSASDSPTLLQRYPRGAEIFAKSNAFFEDARDAYWHFQGCHNPQPAAPGDVLDPALPNYVGAPPLHGQRRAMPFALRCGRLVVLMLDSRGDRDVFRDTYPVLGTEQWQFIDHVFHNLPADVEALAVVTPTPIASMDPDGQTQKLMGGRTDDVELFKRGDLEAFLTLGERSSESAGQMLVAAGGSHLSKLAGRQINLGSFKLSSIDEARDQWSHLFARPEQADLLRKAGEARLANRTAGSPRGLIFLSGDIHVGCLFEISSLNPRYTAASLTSSGISKEEGRSFVVGVFVDEDFAVAPGVRSTLKDVITTFNFGVIQVIPTGAGAKIHGAVAHEGNSFAVGVDVADLL
ncbi:MAG: hypothetical protein GEU99_21000 [Luteitalea sp.]|nr:hypothetical protein [Luteitalea sp.]